MEKFPAVVTVLGDLDNTELMETQAALADIVVNIAFTDHLGSTAAINRGIEKRGGVYVIHTTGTALLFGKPDGNVLGEKVWDDIEDLEAIKSFPETAIHRPAEKLIFDAPPSVRTAIISPGKIYGIGTGPGKIYTIPIFANTMIPTGGTFIIGTGAPAFGSIHIEDLSRLYILLVGEALKPNGGNAQRGPDGYYFGQSNEFTIAEETAVTGEELLKLGLIKRKEPVQMTMEKLAEMHPFFPLLFAASMRCRSSRARKLGWRPREKGAVESIAVDIRVEYKGGVIPTWEFPEQLTAEALRDAGVQKK